jgi:hypothetical protein
MAQGIDGWSLLARIAAHPRAFDACDMTAALTSLLLVRSQLTQGVASEAALIGLAAIVGREAMTEVIANLAGYEALRIVINVDGPDRLGKRRTPDAARRRLVEIVTDQAADHSGSALVSAEPAGLAPAVSAFEPARPLRHHRAMGARRARPALA